MPYLFFILLLISTSAQAEFGFDDGIRKPQSMVVAGDSVIDETPTTGTGDDANEISDVETTTPPMPEVDAFSPPPEVQKPTPTKKVVKKTSPVKIKRTIADERIDDAYVQELMKKNFAATGPIE